jgi:hypothetical protein
VGEQDASTPQKATRGDAANNNMPAVIKSQRINKEIILYMLGDK